MAYRCAGGLRACIARRYISVMPFRMTEQAYLVLLSLAEGRRHGYAIVQAVLDLSDGATRLGAPIGDSAGFDPITSNPGAV